MCSTPSDGHLLARIKVGKGPHGLASFRSRGAIRWATPAFFGNGEPPEKAAAARIGRPTMNKAFATADEAVADIFDGATIMLGGFGLAGIPENLIKALVRKGVKGLRTIANNVGIDGVGMGLMLEAGMIASHIGSYVGENKLLESLVLAGQNECHARSAGHAGGMHPRGRRRYPGVLHARRRGNRRGGRQGSAANSAENRIFWNAL